MALHEEKMELARATVIAKAPYYARAVYGFIFQPYPGVRTMLLTKKLVLGYDPEWAERASVAALAADIVHEVQHFVREHFGRAEGFQHLELWNIAGDLAINPDLIAASWEMSPDALFPKDFGLPNYLTAEEYYERLLPWWLSLPPQKNDGASKTKTPGEGAEQPAGGASPPTQTPTGKQLDPEAGVGAGHCGGMGGHSHTPGIEKELNEEPDLGRTEVEVKDIVAGVKADIQQHIANHGRGSIPGGFFEQLQMHEEQSKISWEAELSQVVMETTGRIQAGGDDYSLSRPSKRSMVYGYVRPGMVEYQPEVAIIRDSSGSMGTPQLLSATREAYAIIQALNIDEVWFTDADTRVATEWKRVGADFFRDLVEVHGRGGTDFVGPLEDAARLTPAPNIVLYITDGDGRAPAEPPADFVVVFVIVNGHYNRSPADWAHAVFVDIDE